MHRQRQEAPTAARDAKLRSQKFEILVSWKGSMTVLTLNLGFQAKSINPVVEKIEFSLVDFKGTRPLVHMGNEHTDKDTIPPSRIAVSSSGQWIMAPFEWLQKIVSDEESLEFYKHNNVKPRELDIRQRFSSIDEMTTDVVLNDTTVFVPEKCGILNTLQKRQVKLTRECKTDENEGTEMTPMSSFFCSRKEYDTASTALQALFQTRIIYASNIRLIIDTFDDKTAFGNMVVYVKVVSI